jgi:hypothetical protein
MSVVNVTEVELASALVAMVRGSRSPVSLGQVLDYMSLHFRVSADKVRVHRFWLDDFILFFNDVVDRVLHALSSLAGGLSLVFRWWCRQSRAIFSPLRYKLLLAIDN